MKKLVIYTVIYICFLACVATCSASDIYVPDDHATIQLAVDNAIAGDTIIVRDGTYIENIDVNVASITIESENGSTNCNVGALLSNDNVFTVTENYVNISGFMLTGATGLYKAGIRLDFVNHSNIFDINASNNDYGIYLYSSSNNNLTNNTMDLNNNIGVRLYSSSNNNLTNNTTNLNNNIGIYLSYSSNNNSLTNNTTNLNNNIGIYLFSSSNNNTLENNNASDNEYGIYLRSSNNNTLENNTMDLNNNIGVRLYSSNNNTLENNTMDLNNNYGIHLYSSSNNIIYNNYFNNTNNIYGDGINTWNITKTLGTNIIGGPYLGGNYWSDYDGNDTDGDGIGDTGTIPFGPGDYLPLVLYSSPTAPSNIYIVTQMRTAYVTWSASTSSNTLQPLHYHWNTTNTTGVLKYDVTTNTYSGAIQNLYPGYYNFSVNATDNTTFSNTVRTQFFMTNTVDMTLQQPTQVQNGNYGVIGVAGLFTIPFIIKIYKRS